MGNLSHLNLQPPAPRDPADQLRDAIAGAGLTPPEAVHLDGKLHRFQSGTKGKPGHDKPGWYIAFADGVPAGRFGDWRTGHDQTWVADIGRQLSPAEQMANARRMAEARALRDAEMARTRQMAAETVERIWSDGGVASADHPYLARKRIATHGARVTGDGRLMVPLYDEDGSLSSLQYIDADGGKLFHPGGASGGRFWWLGDLEASGPIYIAEGFATAATIHETTHRPVVIAYSSHNIPRVAAIMRERFGVAADLAVVADNDHSGTGANCAAKAAQESGTRTIMPPYPGMDANDYALAGHDLAALLRPASADAWLVPLNEFCRQPAPIGWLIKRWVQDDALMMVHGPSGGGKTFVVLDWCLRIAHGIPEWFGQRVKPAPVVYLAGEGHHGLRSRVTAWGVHHNVQLNDKMRVSMAGCDLNKPEGFQQVRQSIAALPEPPRLIVVDTLHRFLSGDENSAEDAKTMIDACGDLQREFRCTVLLVHHTGVSEEAQHRARGSSAWKGALDVEISVVPAKDGAPMELVQRKSKDAELAPTIYAKLEGVTIPEWFDEDGEPVTSAVLVEAEAPERKQGTDDKTAKHAKYFEKLWFMTGAEVVDGYPYISRSAIRDNLANVIPDVRSPATIKHHMDRSYTRGGFINALTTANIIQEHQHGFVLIDDALSSVLLLLRNMAGQK